MANIYIKKRNDPIDLSNVRAKTLKAQWMDKNVSRDTIIDLEVWAGTLSQIQSIELTSERKSYEYEDKPQTNEDRRRTTEGMERLGGWVQKQKWYKDSINSEPSPQP